MSHAAHTQLPAHLRVSGDTGDRETNEDCRNPFADRTALRCAAEAFLLSRAILTVVTILVALIERRSPLSLWDQWDTVWYVGIAEHGYHWAPPGHHASSVAGAALAFFPLLPLVVHVISAPGLPRLAAGLAVANGAFLGALVYLYALLRADWGPGAAQRSLFLLALWPTAFFTAAPYSESLFLLAAAATLFHARTRRSIWAGGWLAVAVLTRSTGFILVLPALLLLRPRTLRAWLLILGPSLCAWTAYLAYLAISAIPVTYLLRAQSAWHRGLTFPWTGFTASVHWLVHGAAAQPQMAAENVGEVVVAAGFLALTALAWRQLTLPMRCYCALFWLLVLCSPEWLHGYAAPFSSMDRFILALFPLAGWCAATLSGRRLRALVACSAVVMAVSASVHITGGWIG